jgi:ribosomal protein S18 acetylase RimI-like enzyme
MLAAKVTLRPVQDSDNEFLMKVYGSTREQELAQVPWTAEQKQQFVRMQYEAQKSHYAARNPQASHEIICLEGTDSGRLYLDRTGEKFHILDITLLPEHRNRGAGSFLMGQIMAEAKEAGKQVSIYVETFNPSLRLFQRLGFTPIQQEGFHLLLQCSG